MRSLFAFLASLLLVLGCKTPSKSEPYTIGVDPSWYPLQVSGEERNLFAFSMELMTEIAKREGLQIEILRMNWNDLMWGLREQKYRAMLSTMRPYAFYQHQYTFSLPYLLTGPVIVLPKKINSNKLQCKVIGVIEGSSAALILQTTPNVLLRGYDSIPAMLKALETEQIDGMALEILAANHYLQALPPGKFQIASAPLNNQGLRLIALHESENSLIKQFDQGLKRLKQEGLYDKLLEKWNLAQNSL